MASREAFIEFVLKCMKPPLHHVSSTEYKEIVKKYQTELLDCMEIENNIAKNAALRENIFMMFVCIELRIPLFLVGKPGSSKSLAKSIIENSLKGKNSKKPTMKKFKQVHLHSHQCSGLSTPASITEVFVNAKNFQDKRDITTFVSVVVLDEVGLAEASPYLPLKALHPLLEDGTEGSGSDDQRISREKRVAFIGISNWALDPAKMNRGIMVTRTEPGITDLRESAIGICSNKGNDDPVLKRLKEYFPKLASAYLNICNTQKREFFGLRDFYSLIKMLYWMSEESGSILTRPQLEHAIRRNFSGYDEFEAVDEFKLWKLEVNDVVDESVNIPSQLKQFRNKDVLMLKTCKMTKEYIFVDENGLIKLTSKQTRNAQFLIHIKDENKFSLQSICNNSLWLQVNQLVLVVNSYESNLQLIETQDKKAFVICSYQQKLNIDEFNSCEQYIFITPDDSITNPDCSPLGLISTSLSNKKTTYHGESRYLLFLTQNYSSLQVLKRYIVTKCLQDFSNSAEGSLQLAEPFVLFGSSFPKDKEFAQVCRNISEIRLCMENGRMVILLNLENLYESLYDVLNQYYMKSGGHRYVDLGLRSNRMKCTVHQNFKLVLIAEREKVYQEFPTPLINRLEKHFVDATTVLQPWQKDVCDQLELWLQTFLTDKFTIMDAFIGYSSDTKAAVVLQATYLADSEQQQHAEKVLEISKKLLLQIASPDAVVRGIYNYAEINKKYQQTYFVQQEHSSLADLINRIPKDKKNLLQVTTHTPTLSQVEFEELGKCIGMEKKNMTRIHLEAFQTEQEFINSIDTMMKKGESHEHCVVFECERAHENGNLISCCRYRLTDKFREAIEAGCLNTKFVFLIHLPKKILKSNFVSFQEHPWLCYHVDAIFSMENSVPLSRILSGEVCLMSDIYYEEDEQNLTDTLIDDTDTIDSQLFNDHYQLLPHSEPRKMNLCKRMYLHISQASSNPEQVNHLTQIVPQKIKFPFTDEITFHSHTIHLIKKILKNEEGVLAQQKWIQDEAMNMTKLQEAGTFQNAIVRKFDGIVIPKFAKIISIVDKYSNLKLLSMKTEPELTKLWLNLYSSDYVTGLIMSNLRSTQNDAITGGISSFIRQFSCQFPFSWVLNVIVNENPAKDGNELYSVLKNYNLIKYFEILPGNIISSLARFYVHDFVHLLDTKAQPEEQEYYEVLYRCMISMSAKSYSDELDIMSLLHIIVDVQGIYHKNKKFFHLFSELIVLMPSTVDKINAIKSIPHIQTLLVKALELFLDSPYLDVQGPLNNEKKVALRGWMQKQYDSHKVITSIVEECTVIDSEVLLRWQWICVMKLFFEHVVLQNETDTMFFARRIEKFSAKIRDFQKSDSLSSVAFLLNGIEKGLKKLDSGKQIAIKQNCWSFFLEVLSSLCFNGKVYHEEIVDTLIHAVFPTSVSSVEDAPCVKDDKLSIYLQNHNEELPLLQSFAIKLIMQYEFGMTQHKLNVIRKKTGSKSEQIVIGLFLANLKAKMKDEAVLSIADSLLQEEYDILKQCKNDGALSSQNWIVVAKLTKALQVLAKKLNETSRNPFFNMDADPDASYLFSEAKDFCTSSEVNDEQTTSGPLWYLIRYIIRTFGSISLMKILQNDFFKWIMPSDDFHQSGEFMDIVAVYNPIYQGIRAAVSRATTGDFCELKQAVTNLDPTFTVPLALALFERIRLSYATDIPSKKLSPEIIQKFSDFAKTCHLFNPEVSNIVDELIFNKQCSIFSSMQARKDNLDDSIYQMLVVHSVLTVVANSRTQHVMLLSDFIFSPGALKEFLLPAMPIIFSRIKEEEESFLQCTSGHQYTNIMLDSHCLHCGKIIQYSSKSLGIFENTDDAFPGYIPLHKKDRNPPTGYLSNASYAIIRCIMHSCLLWSSCNGEDIFPLMNGRQLTATVPDYYSFFWGQVKEDIQQLSSVTGHSIDEAALLVHLVLKQINEKGHHVQLMHQTEQNAVGELRQLIDRSNWEEQFYECYIAPVVEDTEYSIQKTLKELTSKDYSKLFAAVYITPMTSEPFLWNVYPELTIQQICGQLLAKQLSDDHPVLFTYLSEVHRFEAMTLLPDILKMLMITQKAITYDKTTQEAIENMSFIEFVHQLSLEAYQKEEYHKCFASFKHAWELCQHELDNGRLIDLKNDYVQEEVTEETKMKFLIPTTYGPGVITTGLIDHLVISHNKFIRLCRKFVENSLKKNWLWQNPKVPLQKLCSTHFIKCSDEFVKLVQRHSIYTTSNGNVKIQLNNLSIIERDFVQEFALGKPIITHILDIPQVMWEQPVHNTQIITAVKRNIAQQALPPQVRSGILMDLKDNLAEMTVISETLEIVMRFLQDKKEQTKRKLKDYVEKDLHITGKLRSEKVTDYCCLEHVVALWRFINVERAKYRVRNKEDPFIVKADFMEPLIFISENNNQTLLLDSATSKMTNVDNMLEVMYEMIQTYVQTCSLEDANKELRVVLFDYVHQTKSEPISNLMELFPPEIKLSQVVCTWKEIVGLQDAIKRRTR